MILAILAACGATNGPLRAVDPATNSTRVLAPEVTLAPGTDPAPPPAARPPGPNADPKADLGKYRGIIARAPFRNSLLPQTSAAGVSASNPQLKLNGIIRIGDQISAGIEDTVQRRSLILPVGSNEEGIQIQAIDELTQTVSLFYNGQPMTLTIEKTPGSSGQAPTPMMQTPEAIQPSPGPATNNIQPPGVRRKRIIIPRER